MRKKSEHLRGMNVHLGCVEREREREREREEEREITVDVVFVYHVYTHRYFLKLFCFFVS